jgi:hypothetical protein
MDQQNPDGIPGTGLAISEKVNHTLRLGAFAVKYAPFTIVITPGTRAIVLHPFGEVVRKVNCKGAMSQRKLQTTIGTKLFSYFWPNHSHERRCSLDRI